MYILCFVLFQQFLSYCFFLFVFFDILFLHLHLFLSFLPPNLAIYPSSFSSHSWPSFSIIVLAIIYAYIHICMHIYIFIYVYIYFFSVHIILVIYMIFFLFFLKLDVGEWEQEISWLGIMIGTVKYLGEVVWAETIWLNCIKNWKQKSSAYCINVNFNKKCVLMCVVWAWNLVVHICRKVFEFSKHIIDHRIINNVEKQRINLPILITSFSNHFVIFSIVFSFQKITLIAHIIHLLKQSNTILEMRKFLKSYNVYVFQKRDNNII